MRFLNRALIIILALAAVVAAGAAPQDEIVFSALGIDLWPDYDRRGVLVIYRGSIAPGAGLPARLTLRIPAAAGAPSALAERRSDGQLVNLVYERRVEGDVALIDATITRPDVQLEYYDPDIARADATHAFDFLWPGDYGVADLTVTVQQPDLATDLVTDPATARQAPGGDGLVYHTVPLGARAAGETAVVAVTYEKATDQLSIETLPAPPAATPTPAPGSANVARSTDDEVLIVVIAVLAILVVGALLFALTRGRTAAAPPSAGRPAPRSGGARFCTQCGAAAGSGDRFCHHCGAALQ